MSGFIMIYNTDNKPVQPRLLSYLVESLKFRGPDKQKIWIDNNIGMGHALFRTTYEAEYENQPATIDNKVWITCSARIDDRDNLVNKMGLKQSLDLSKTPDSELILHAYRKWGEDCLDHLLGDFAFAIWDSRVEKLFCARDRFGMRALYFTQKKNTIIICNSIHTVLQHPYITKELNKKAIGGFLLMDDHTWIDPTITSFKNINSLSPAHKLVFKDGKTIIQKYWDVPFDIPILTYKKESDYIEHFQEIFETAIKERLRTSSVVISMSGGMDSTSIAATIKKMQTEQTIESLKVQAVTGVYDRIITCGERYYSGLVAEKLNIPIHYVVGDEDPMFLDSIPTTRPVHGIVSSFSLNIHKTISKYGRVALTGDSADNILAYSFGKSTFKEQHIFNILSCIYQSYQHSGKLPFPSFSIRNLVKNIIGIRKPNNTIAYNFPYPSWINPNFEKQIDLKNIHKEWLSNKLNPIHPRHPYMHTLLVKPNWNNDDFWLNPGMSLAEKRDPFLDIRLINFIFSLPQLPWLYNKYLLRKSMENFLPKEVVKRPKSALFNLKESLLNEEKNKWILEWKANKIISDYIDIKKLSSSIDNNLGTLTHSHSRALILEQWIQQINDN